MNENTKIKLTALWEKTSKNGTKYWTGRLGDAGLIIFENQYKTEQKHPDLIVYLDQPARQKEEQDSGPQIVEEKGLVKIKNSKAKPAADQSLGDDDLPF